MVVTMSKFDATVQKVPLKKRTLDDTILEKDYNNVHVQFGTAKDEKETKESSNVAFKRCYSPAH